MAQAVSTRGRMVQGDRPEWRPLLDAVGEELSGDFMWMFEVELANQTSVQAYKHIDTRRYIHLARDLSAYVYEPPDRYRRFPASRVLAAVFAPLAGLGGVTDEQVARSWAAVDLLSGVVHQ